MTRDPHRDQPVLTAGRELSGAAGAIILVHGRGASAEDILQLRDELDYPELAYVAPQAAENSWYPYSFLAPIEQNEPWLTSALNKLTNIVGNITREGIPQDKIVIAGFSTGGMSRLRVRRQKCGELRRTDRIHRRLDRAAGNRLSSYWQP